MRLFALPIVVFLASCGVGNGGAPTEQEAESRLEEVLSATAESAGLEYSEFESKWSLCQDTTTQALSIGISLHPSHAEGIDMLESVHSFWIESAPELVGGSEFSLDDRSVSAPSAPRIFLEFDGYSLSAAYDAGLERFRLGGSAPCIVRDGAPSPD